MRRTSGLAIVAIMLLIQATCAGVAPHGAVAAQAGTAVATSGRTADHANPTVGDTVTFITESGSSSADLTLTEVIAPWDEYSEYYEPDEGTRYVAFVVEITNFGTRGSLIVGADDFRLQDDDGFLLSRALADAADDATVVPTGSDVAIGSGETGEIIVVFAVLDGVGLSHLFWQPDFDRLLTIATLDNLAP